MKSSRRSAATQAVAARLGAESLVLIGIFGWWLTSLKFPVTVFPSPANVFIELGHLAIDPEFWINAAITGSRVLAAVLAATFFGTVLGLLPRYVPWTRGIIDDVLIPFFNSFPAVAWAILGSVWFGITPKAILVVQTVIILPFCLVNVAEGVKELGTEEVEMGLSFGRSRFAVFWRIELPMLRPFIIAGARIAYGVCWKVSLIAELFGAHAGLGFQMQIAQDFGRVDTIIAICLAIVIFVMLGDAFVLRPLSRLFETGAAPQSGPPPPAVEPPRVAT
jgi:NitT/TauT family transport system permease protein